MRTRLALVALLVTGLGVFSLVAGARVWVRQGEEQTLAEYHLHHSAEQVEAGLLDDAQRSLDWAEGGFDTASSYRAVAKALLAGAVIFVGGGVLLYRRAVRRRRSAVLDVPRPEV